MPINVIDILKPANNGQFPTHEDTDGYGGFQVRQNSADRDSIPVANRKTGMMVYVIDESKFYQLQPTNTWSEALFSASKLKGSPISPDAPSDGNILTWDGAQWKPSPPSEKKSVDLNCYTAPDSNTWMHFKFDESEGETNFSNTGSSSTSIPSATIVAPSGSPTKIYATSAGNLFGRALWSNGDLGPSNQSYAKANHSAGVNPGSEITVSCWVKLTSNNIKTNLFVAKKRLASASDWNNPPHSFEMFTLVPDSTFPQGCWAIKIAKSSSTDVFIALGQSNSDHRLTLETWHLLAFTYSASGGQLKAYLNGQLVDSITNGNSSIHYDQGDYFIGGAPNDSIYKPIHGFIDDVRIENTVREQSYIQAMYDKAKPLLSNKAYVSRSQTLEIIDSSNNYKRNSRIYTENDGKQTLALNAKWNSSSNKWQQENSYLPSSIISAGVFNGRFYNEHFKSAAIGIATKSPGSSDWSHSDWEPGSLLPFPGTFYVETGTTSFLDDTSKTTNFAKLSLGPADGSPGYGRIELHGNTNRGSTSNLQGGPHITIGRSYPSANNVAANTLYSANIPKATASFYGERTYNMMSSTNSYSANVVNSFNIDLILYDALPFANINQDNTSILPPSSTVHYGFKVVIKTAITNMVPIISYYSDVFPIDRDYNATYTPSLNDTKPIILRDQVSPESILWIVFIGSNAPYGYQSIPITINKVYSPVLMFENYRTPTFNLVIFGEQ